VEVIDKDGVVTKDLALASYGEGTLGDHSGLFGCCRGACCCFVVHNKPDARWLGEIAGEVEGEAAGVISLCWIYADYLYGGQLSNTQIIGVGEMREDLDVITSIPCPIHRRAGSTRTERGKSYLYDEIQDIKM
jgi:hypothetical protein